MNNLEKYEPMENDGLVIMPHGQLAMAIRSDNDGDQYCMMMQLGKDFDGMCIPMGYWIVPDLECDVPHHWICIDPISEYWVINNELHYNYDAIIGETLLTWPWEIGLKR